MKKMTFVIFFRCHFDIPGVSKSLSHKKIHPLHDISCRGCRLSGQSISCCMWLPCRLGCQCGILRVYPVDL